MDRGVNGEAMEQTTHRELEQFIRQTLGCGCPDEVFQRIELERIEASRWRINVGGRLLIETIDCGEADCTVPFVTEQLKAAIRRRDDETFNRFRLVLIEPQDWETLAGLPDTVTGADGRLHLHRIARSELPQALR